MRLLKSSILVLLIVACWSSALYAGTVAKFGIITDIHHTNKEDSTSRIYSAGIEKTSRFIREMVKNDAEFIIELGDIVDTLNKDKQKDPVLNLTEIEGIFKSYPGPSYHVLGNHEFDNLTRDEFLSNIGNTGIEQGRTYYSFDSNGVHYIVLDADYTIAEPHRSFDMNTADDTFWNWKDAWIPQDELDWLKKDLASSKLPTVIFSHQVVHRDTTENHTIKNADVLRKILEDDGDVIAAFSGHDHSGEYKKINGINYFVLRGNVGFSQEWPEYSSTGGADIDKDSQYALIQIDEDLNGEYRISVNGNGYQSNYTAIAKGKK